MAWLAGWNNRIPISIRQKRVDSDLENFPVLIKLSESSGMSNKDVTTVFDELTTVTGTKKIAITTSDGTSQCFVEIENWDWENESAWLWTKIPDINSDRRTPLYLYYDKDHADNDYYVGETTSSGAQNVWDSNFVGVWHMSQDPSTTTQCILDSTINENHGVPTPPVLNTTHLDEDMADISDWTDQDAGTGESTQVTFDGKSCMKLTSGANTGVGNYARRWRDIGSCGTRVVIEVYVYCDAITGGNDALNLTLSDADTEFRGKWRYDGFFIHNGTIWQEVGTDIVQQDAWQKWVFDINFTAQTVDVYLDNALVGEDVDCSVDGTFTDGLLAFEQLGYNVANRISYVDYIKVGDAFTNTPMASNDLIGGKVGKALDFDGTDDNVNCGDDTSLDITDLTISVLFKKIEEGSGCLAGRYNVADKRIWQFQVADTEKIRVSIGNSDGTGGATQAEPDQTVAVGEYSYCGFKFEDGVGVTGVFINDTSVSFAQSQTYTSLNSSDNDEPLVIGAYAVYSNPFEGIIDEVRISNICRSDVWMKTDYYSNWDDLLTFDINGLQSIDTNCVIHGNPYYNASSEGVEIFNEDISTEACIAYIEYEGGINSIALYDDLLLMATTNSGIYALPTSTITGTNISSPDDLTPYIYNFKDYPDITDSYVKYLHSSGDYLCCVTASGVDHFNFGTSDAHYRSCATISDVEKCWQTSKGRFYYTKTDSLSTIYSYMCDWDENSVGYVYETTGSGNLFFPEGCEIQDISVTEGMSIYTTTRGATNNLLFLATTSGVVLIEEKQGDEENSRFKQYFVEE